MENNKIEVVVINFNKLCVCLTTNKILYLESYFNPRHHPNNSNLEISLPFQVALDRFQLHLTKSGI